MTYNSLVSFLKVWRVKVNKRENVRQLRTVFFEVDLPYDLLNEMWEFLWTGDLEPVISIYSHYMQYEKIKKCDLKKYLVK